MTHQKSKWALEPAHCKISFSVKHFGIAEVGGHFKKFEGTVSTEMGDFSDAQINFSADVASITTDVEQRDQHLNSADFFQSELHPIISFKSKSLSASADSKQKLIGDLTMRGITKEVSLDVIFNGIVEKDPYGNTIAGFKITGEINRKEWSVSWNTLLDHGGLAVSNEVKIICNIELIKQK